jgi:signal transduction histidine kinase
VLLDTVLAEGKASFTLHSDVSGKTCNAQCYAIASPDGKQRVLLIVRDISQQTDGERARKELLSVITHELRTPLTSIKGALELLKGGATGALSDQASSLVTIATANSERMLGLIRDILEMEEINQAGFEITPEHLNLSALVQSTLEAHSGYGAHLAVSFADAGTEPDLFTVTDPRRVSQVLSNLLSNAAKVTERGGTVELWARREGAEAAIYVRDHGPGIPEALRDKLFERFAKSSEPEHREIPCGQAWRHDQFHDRKRRGHDVPHHPAVVRRLSAGFRRHPAGMAHPGLSSAFRPIKRRDP